MKIKRTLTALAAVMLVLTMIITGCGKKSLVVNSTETDAPETDIFNGDIVDDYEGESEEETDVFIETEIEYEYDDGSLKDTVYTEGEIDVRIVFEPRDYIPDANWANYAAEAVSVIADEFSREGYNVSVADVYCVKIFDEGCIAGMSDLLYTMTVDYVIHVWGEDGSDETDALDGAVLDDKGRLFLSVGNFNINGKYREEYKCFREGEINSVYGEDNPERFALAATDILNEMKDKYADADVEFDTVMTHALEEMFPVYYNVEGLTCSVWSYTHEASQEDSNIIEANVQIYTADYILGDNGIECTSEIYSHMDWMYCKTSRGYELMTWYGYDVEEEEKDSALIEECDSQAAALFAVDAEIIG